MLYFITKMDWRHASPFITKLTGIITANGFWCTIIFKTMNINNLYKSQSDLFKILAHPVRLSILEILREGEQCVCHMEAMLDLRQAYISQHLMVLREAGVLADRRDGWNIYYRVIKPEVSRRYSSEDAFLMSFRNKHDGPWDESEQLKK